MMIVKSRSSGRLALVESRRSRRSRRARPSDRSGACLSAANVLDPRTRKQAMRENPEGWSVAESAEITNHRDNGSWTALSPSSLPSGRKLVKLVWVYKVKRSGKLKARLCVQGCSQVPGVDYDQTWCGTMRAPTLRLLSALSARHGLIARRWDFVAAYLQGELEEDEVVYCHAPPGYEQDANGKPYICRVEKPVYGMAQAGRRWQRTIFPWFTDPEQGFTQSTSDPCVFFKQQTVQTPNGPRDEKLILGCYVDDLYTLASHDDEHSLYASFVRNLQARWEVEDEGEIADLLNVEISREGKQVVLRQRGYIDRMCGLHLPDETAADWKRVKTPCTDALPRAVSDAQSSATEPRDPALVKRYQSLVGALNYCATNTRPDIAFSVGYLSRALSCPTEELESSALRVLRYLGAHRDLGLFYDHCDDSLVGRSDSDWAVKHSTTGFVFTFCRAAISWGSKRQKSIALSSCEAEIVAASEAAKEATYFGRFLEELGEGSGSPVELGVDNQAARDLAYNPEHHERTKHIDRRHFFIREKVEEGVITVPYVNTDDNIADFFTKPLDVKKFRAFRDRIMNTPPHTGSSMYSDGGVSHGGPCDMDAEAPAGCHWVSD